MVDGARASSMLGACPLMMPCSGFVSKWSCPIPRQRAARRTRVLNRNPTGSRRHSDRMSITVDDVSFLLDRSGCRMLPSGSAPEGKWWRLQHYKTNVGVYNTIRTVTCLEGLKAPILSYPNSTFLQMCRVWSLVLQLT